MQNENLQKDRRKFKRLKVNIPLDEVYIISKQQQRYVIKDISVGGVRLESEVEWERKTPIEVGTVMKLSFKIPETNHIVNVNGEVVWHYGKIISDNDEIVASMGVKFLNLSESDRKAIESLIES
jgi:c-di-GMP-binding flagellar brake protein YcgR